MSEKRREIDDEPQDVTAADTNRGDAQFMKVFERETGLDCDNVDKSHINPSRSIGQALRK